MNNRRLKTLYKKEIMDVLRDKKTILTMIVLPVILYPILFMVIMQIVSYISTTQEENNYYIAYENVENEYRNILNDWIAGDEDELTYSIKEVVSKAPKQDLENEKIDAYITATVTAEQIVYEIHYLSAVTNSSNVSEMLQKEIEALTKKCAEQNVKEEKLSVEHFLYPVQSTLTDYSSNESVVGSVFGGIIPFLMITTILMGAVYPAIDATAGEKERGTMETLMTLPIKNTELIMGKFLSVATIAVVSVFINILSISGIAGYLYVTIVSLTDGAGTFQLKTFVPAVLISVVCVIAFALFISAITMCICAFAKSFKEANNYVTPLTLVVMLTGYIGLIPNIELSNVTALIPVANICLLMKELLVFKYNFSMIIIVLLSNILYAFISVRVLASIYNSESILFGEAASGMNLFERRKNIKKGSMPEIAESLLVLVVALLLVLYIGGIVALKHPIAGVLVQQLCIVSLPLLASMYTKADFKRVFCLKVPHLKQWIGAVLLWMGVVSASLLLSGMLTRIFGEENQNLQERYSLVFDEIPFWGSLLLVAVMPAICEEIMYRGYLFSALKHKMKPGKAILIVSLLFGMSHFSILKLLPTMLLGMALAYAVYQADSILVSALMHFLNNAFSVCVVYYGSKITWLNFEESDWSLVIGMLAISCVAIPLGMICMKKKQSQVI